MIADADAVSIPEAAGREALARLLSYAQPAVAPGPVGLTADGRALFYVAPGAREDLAELLDWLDWGGVGLDLVAYSAAELAGTAVGTADDTVPDTTLGAVVAGDPVAGLRPVAWLHPPETEPPELIALLATLAAACHRMAVTRGAHAGRR